MQILTEHFHNISNVLNEIENTKHIIPEMRLNCTVSTPEEMVNFHRFVDRLILCQTIIDVDGQEQNLYCADSTTVRDYLYYISEAHDSNGHIDKIVFALSSPDVPD